MKGFSCLAAFGGGMSDLGLGRMVAIRKPTGGTRGLVVGDFFRRLIARTLAQQFAPSIEAACRPHQYALGNRAGLDALVHNVQARCARDPALSAAYDGISRQAILHELRQVPKAAALLPFARLWLGRPSSFVWQQGPASRSISQAEGVEQGPPPLCLAAWSVCFSPWGGATSSCSRPQPRPVRALRGRGGQRRRLLANSRREPSWQPPSWPRPW